MESSRVELQAEIARWQRRILRLPTPESQTLEWLQFDRVLREERGAHPSDLRLWLERGGFAIYLKSRPWVGAEGPEFLCLTLANVRVPTRYQRRGWFKHYLNLCHAMMPHEGLMLEEVTNPGLFDWLTQQPDYEVLGKCFLRRKHSPRVVG